MVTNCPESIASHLYIVFNYNFICGQCHSGGQSNFNPEFGGSKDTTIMTKLFYREQAEATAEFQQLVAPLFESNKGFEMLSKNFRSFLDKTA